MSRELFILKKFCVEMAVMIGRLEDDSPLTDVQKIDEACDVFKVLLKNYMDNVYEGHMHI